MTDPIVDAVCDKFQSRSAVGIKKYGTTLADSNAPMEERLTHLQEELMDAANYVEWLLQDYFSYGVSPAMVAVKMMEKDMPTPMTIEMENEMTKDEIQAALNKLEEPLWLNGGRSVPLIIRELLGVKHYETIRSALQSPRVPVIEILETVLEQAEDDGLWFNAKYASEAYLQQELRRLHTVIERAYAELSKTQEPSLAPPQKGV